MGHMSCLFHINDVLWELRFADTITILLCWGLICACGCLFPIQLNRCLCKIHVIDIVLFPSTTTCISTFSYDSLCAIRYAFYTLHCEMTLLNYNDLDFGWNTPKQSTEVHKVHTVGSIFSWIRCTSLHCNY